MNMFIKQFFLMIIISLFFANPTFATDSKNATLFKGDISIGTEIWPGYIALYLAKAKGFYQDEGINVNIKTYKEPNKISEDYMAGKIHGRGCVTIDAVTQNLLGLDHKIVLAIGYSNGSDGIITKKNIKTIGQLSGKRIAYLDGSASELFLSSILSQRKMFLNRISSKDSEPQNSIQLFTAGETDAVVTHEPYLSELATDPSFHVLYSSANTPGLITNILSFRSDFIEKYPDTIKAIIRAYFKGLDYMKQNPEEAYNILSNEFKIDPDVLKAQFKGIAMLNKKDNDAAFAKNSGYWSLYNNIKIVDNFFKNQYSKASINSANLIEPIFIREFR